MLAVGKRHALAKRKSVPMRALADLDLVLLTQEFGARRVVDRYLAAAHLQPRVVLEMNAIEPILATVRGASLATVVSAGAVGSGLHAIRLTDPTPRRNAAILWRRDAHPSPAARRMAEMIRAAYGKAPKPRRASHPQ